MKLLHHIDERPDTACLNQELSDLTPCEWTLLLHIANDLANAEIAEKLCVSIIRALFNEYRPIYSS